MNPRVGGYRWTQCWYSAIALAVADGRSAAVGRRKRGLNSSTRLATGEARHPESPRRIGSQYLANALASKAGRGASRDGLTGSSGPANRFACPVRAVVGARRIGGWRLDGVLAPEIAREA
jgi:hypothetical protein